MSGYCPEGIGTCRDADSGPCVVGHPCELYPLRELALLLNDGTLIRDPSWMCVADVMMSFHGFGVGRAYGQLQTDEGEPLTEMLLFQERP